MNETGTLQPCPRCSVPGGEQHHMKRLHINFTESVNMCLNSKCLWMQLVSSVTDSGTHSTRLPGTGGGGDEFDHLLSSLWEPSVDSGVDADCSDRSVSSWEPASSDAGSLCSELAGVGLSSVTSESGGRWRPASAPVGQPRSTPGSLPADTRSEPDLATLMRATRRSRLAHPRPQSGLSLRNFNNGELRSAQRPVRTHSSMKGSYSSPAVFRRPLPPWERAALRQSLTPDSLNELLFAGDRTGRRRHNQSVSRRLKQAEKLAKRAEKLAKRATAATTTVLKRAASDAVTAPSTRGAAATTATTSTVPPAAAATSGRGAAATTATTSAVPPAAAAASARGAAATTATTSAVPPAAAAASARGAAATTATTSAVPPAAAAASAAPESQSGPAPATEPAGAAKPPAVVLPPARHVKARAASASEVAARLDRALAAPELRQLYSALNTDQVFVRSRQVERVKAWARKKTGTAGR